MVGAILCLAGCLAVSQPLLDASNMPPSQLGTSLVAQTVKHLPTMQETQVQCLRREDLLEKEMATHSSILAWRIPWTEETVDPHGVTMSWTRLSDLSFLPFPFFPTSSNPSQQITASMQEAALQLQLASLLAWAPEKFKAQHGSR